MYSRIEPGTTSATPDCTLVNTGTPEAIASIATLPNGSNSDGNAKASAPRIRWATSERAAEKPHSIVQAEPPHESFI